MWPECAEHPDALALLRAALADPTDRTPRLALADWLQEHGLDVLAAHVRESCASADWSYIPTEDRGRGRRFAPWDACCDGWIGVNSIPEEGTSALPMSPWLTALQLNYDDGTDDAIADLARFPNLAVLDLTQGQGVTDAGLPALAALKHLARLELQLTSVTDAGMRTLAAFPKLHDLDLRQTAVTDAGLKALAPLDLTRLALGERVTDAGVKFLTRFKNLAHLDLSGRSVTNVGLEPLAKLKHLTSLVLDDITIRNSGLKAVAGLKRLTHLTLRGKWHRDTDARHLAPLPALTHLEIYCTKVTDASAKALAGMTKLVRLNLARTKIHRRPDQCR